MKNDKIIKIAAITIIGVILVPRIINTGATLIGETCTMISNIVNKSKFNKRIKNGLKDGSIVEIDGQYYELNERIKNGLKDGSIIEIDGQYYEV